MATTLGTYGEEMNLEIRQGATFGPFRFDMTNPDGSPVDLTGCTFSARLKKKAKDTAKFDLTVTLIDAPNGAFEMSMSATDTSALQVGDRATSSESTYVWDMDLIDASGRVTPLYYGKAYVFRDV